MDKNGTAMDKNIGGIKAKQMKVERVKDLYKDMLATAPDAKKEREKIAAVLQSLQREDGSWRVIENLNIDSDARIEFAYLPTYYATAALMYLQNADGDQNEPIRECLERGLGFAILRKFAGHGFECIQGRLDALSIYKEAGMYPWMRKYGENYPEFSSIIRNINNGYRLDLINGNTRGDWDREFKEEFQREVDEYDSKAGQPVWYAAYGSNLSMDRFMEYINRCTDHTAPAENRPWKFKHSIFFAGSSTRWGKKGTAYLNDKEEGFALGRIYKINMDQFNEIQRMEGPSYSKRLFLGMLDETPVFTFTSEGLKSRNVPYHAYLDVIVKGLLETYPEKSKLALEMYLYRKGLLEQTDLQVLAYIRDSAHGVSLEDIAYKGTDLGITKVRPIIKTLHGLHLIKQDGRSVQRGDKLTSNEAVVYTRDEKRELADLLLLA